MALGNDSDLSSAPSSSETSDIEYDPLLDFSRGLDSYSLPPPNQEASRAAVLGSVMKANQALRKIRDITMSLAAEKAQQTHSSPPLVFSQASMNVAAKPTKPTSPPQAGPTTPPPAGPTTPPHAGPTMSPPGTTIFPPSSSPSPPAVTITHPPHGLPPRSVRAHGSKLLTELELTATQQQPHPSVEHQSVCLSEDEPLQQRASDSPPPVPPYTPSSPDRFLLSNKPAYQLEVKRQRHTYEEVMLDGQNEPQAPPPPPPPLLRIRGHGAKDQLPAKAYDSSSIPEPSHKQKSFTPAQAPTSSTSTDMSVACQGLPENG